MRLRVVTLNVQNTEGPAARQRLITETLRDLAPASGRPGRGAGGSAGGDEPQDGIWLSDHFGVCVDLDITADDASA